MEASWLERLIEVNIIRERDIRNKMCGELRNEVKFVLIGGVHG